jgi:excisionase family DNA binding protein
MTTVSAEVLAKSRELVESLRQEGRPDDAAVIDTLVRAVDRARPYFTTGQVARRLGVSRQTIVNWIKQGYLPGERVGARMMVPASAFDQYAEIEKVLDALDAERPPLTPEEAAEVVGRGREHWTWVGREILEPS